MFKNSVIYVASSILSAALPFLLLPILTHYLSPEQYGQVAMYTTFTAALASLIGLSVHGAASRRFFDKDVTSEELSRFNGNCFFILLMSTFLILLLVYCIDGFIANYLDIPISWIYLAVLNVFCAFVLNLRLGQWQIRGMARIYGLLQVLNAFIVLAFSLLFVISLNLGASGRVYGMILGSILIGFVAFYTLIRDKLFTFKYNAYDIKDALAFGVPLIPHAIGGFLLLSVDRLVINNQLGLDMTGIYMVAYSLGMALNLIFNSVNKAYSPWLFGKLSSATIEMKYTIVKNTYFLFLFLLIMSVLAYYVTPPIVKLLVGEEFHQAADVLPLIIIGQVFLGMYFMVTNYIFYVKKTKYLSYVTISSGIVNVSLLLLLIPHYGIHGAALAFLIANFWQFIWTWFISAKLYSMPWTLRRF